MSQYQPLLSVFRHCPLLKFQIFKQPPFSPVTSLPKQVVGHHQFLKINQKSKKILAALMIPPPCGVKSHARDDGQVTRATKLKDLTPGVKVPDFNDLK